MPNELEPMEPPVKADPVTRFFGGSPLAVLMPSTAERTWDMICR